MNDIIRSALGYAVVIAIIVGVGKLWKSQNKVVIDPNDQSMRAEEYAYGSYSVKTNILKVTEFQQGDVVAYYVPGTNAEKVGRIAAIEGQTISGVPLKAVKVNGVTAAAFKIDNKDWNLPEIRVPRGCVFILHDKPNLGEDSMKAGPIPYYNIKGKLN